MAQLKKYRGIGWRSFIFLIVSVACVDGSIFAAATTSTTPAATQPTSAPVTQPTTRHVIVKQTKENAPPASFKLTDAATKAETDSISLRGIESVIHNDNTATQIEDDLPNLTSEIDARLDESNKLLASSPSLQLLGTQEQAWESIQQNLEEAAKTLERRLDLLQQQADSLKGTEILPGMLDKWQQEIVLLDWVSARPNTQAIVQQAQKPIEDTIALIQTTQKDLDSATQHVRVLQASIDSQHARVIKVLDAVRQSRDQAFSRLLRRTSPPLWSRSLYTRDAVGIVQQGQDSFARQAQGTAAYIRQRWENIGAHAAILLALLMGLFMVRRKVGGWTAEDAALKEHTRIFCSPVPTAFALSLLIAIWIYPEAPRLFWAAIGASALVPTVIILRKLIDALLFPVLNALVAFYFMDQVRSIAAVVPIAARVVLLAEMVGAALLVFTFIRSTRHLQTPIWDLIRGVSWLWTVVFIVAAVCNIIGFVSLANLLGDATLGSAYLAVILYAASVIVSGLVLIAVRSRPVNLLRMVQDNQTLVIRRLTRVVRVVAVLAWVAGLLESLSVLSAAYDLIQKILSTPLLSTNSLHLTLRQAVAFVFTVWLSFLISRFLRFTLEEDVYDRFKLPSGIPYAISRLLHYVVLMAGFFIAFSTLGNDLSTLNVLAGAFGVGLAFGTQNIVNNFVSGLILLFERPVKVGDVIQLDDTTGVVNHIGIRASIIRTMDSSEIIVPNGMLISSKVTNWTLSNRQRGIQIQIGLASNAEPNHVMQLLTTVAAANSMISKIPAPQAFLTKFAGDSFNYELHAWTNNAERWIQIRSDLSVALNAALVKDGIAIK